MPAVPNVPGVPALTSYLPSAITLLTSDAIIGSGLFAVQQWGIFEDGAPVIVPDTIVDLDLTKDWTISDFPLEQGAFQSYDKVIVPFESRVRMALGGSVADRSDFLQTLDSISGTLDLYSIVTPETIYPSVNIRRYTIRRQPQSGLGMLVVDVSFIQVRVTGSAQFNNTQTASGANQQSGGSVQTSSLSAAQTSTISAPNAIG
jgi:hypothetical protein